MNFIDYCVATKNFSALEAVEDYTKSFGFLGAGKGLFGGLKDAYKIAKNRGGYKGLGDMLLNLRGVRKTLKDTAEKKQKLLDLRKKMDTDKDLKNLMSNYLFRKSDGKGKKGGYDISDRNVDDLVRSGRSVIKNAYEDKGYNKGYKTGKDTGWDSGLKYGLEEGRKRGVQDAETAAEFEKMRKIDHNDLVKKWRDEKHGTDED